MPGFAVDNSGKFNWGVAATDIEWGYDGKLYVSDFVSGWQSHNAGRVYTLEEQNPGKTAAEFLAEFDFATATPRSLSGLLATRRPTDPTSRPASACLPPRRTANSHRCFQPKDQLP